ERADNVQQRALAGAGWPDDGCGFAASDLQRDAAQHRHRVRATRRLVILGNVSQLQQWRWHVAVLDENAAGVSAFFAAKSNGRPVARPSQFVIGSGKRSQL